MSEGAVQIGELSKRTGVSRRSLRYYEQRGLLQARRTDAGWREYDEAIINRVRNVQELLEAGMTVDDIRKVAPCLDGDDLLACDQVDEAVELHEARLEVIDARMATLARHRDSLVRRIDRLRALRAHPGARSGRPAVEER